DEADRRARVERAGDDGVEGAVPVLGLRPAAEVGHQACALRPRRRDVVALRRSSCAEDLRRDRTALHDLVEDTGEPDELVPEALRYIFVTLFVGHDTGCFTVAERHLVPEVVRRPLPRID